MDARWDGPLPEPMTLDRTRITVLPDLQVRALPPGRGPLCLREEQVTTYMELITDARARTAQAGTSSNDLGRLAIVKTESGSYLLADGFHRHEAYKRLNITDIPVLIYHGTKDDALLLACVLNAQRGLPFGPADRGKVAEIYLEAYLRRYPGVSLPTDSEIGRRLGISRSTVTRAARDLTKFYQIPPSRLVQRGTQQFEMTPATRPRQQGSDPFFLVRDDDFASQPTPLPQTSPGSRRSAPSNRSRMPHAERSQRAPAAPSASSVVPRVPVDVDGASIATQHGAAKEIDGQITWVVQSATGAVVHGVTPFDCLHELPDTIQRWLAQALAHRADPLE